jgi:starch synthase (maltosyl-transferring)
MFKSRFALALTLSSNYGMYSGYELLEHEPIPGREEYLYSEKYEIKTRDWNKPGNIKDTITRLNRIRRENAALLQTADLRFAQIDDDEVIGFVKESVDHDNAVACAIALTGLGPRSFWFHFGDITIGPPDNRQPVRSVVNLGTGERHTLEWGGVRLTINPAADPALLFRCES